MSAQAIREALAGASRSTTGWYRIHCPACGDRTGKADRKGSLSVSATTGFWTCWKCAYRGRLAGFDGVLDDVVEEHKGIDVPEEFIPLYGREGQAFCLEPARQYLDHRLGTRWRGHLGEQLRLHAALDGRFAGRVVAPLLDIDGRTWLGYVARDWTGQARQKYLNARGMGRSLWNRVALRSSGDYDWAAGYVNDFTLVVEGVFDAMPYWPFAVACLGKPNEEQVQLLLDSDRPLVIALDGDAWEEGWALARRLQFRGIEAVALRLPPGSDPGTVHPSRLIQQAREALGERP